MKSILTLLCVCLLNDISFSQDTYTFTCRLNENKATALYHGFLLRQANGSGFIRLYRSTERGRTDVYDLEWGAYRSGDDVMTDYAEQRMHYPYSSDSFLCIRARFIRPVSGQGNDNLTGLTLWFKQNKKSTLFEPYTGSLPFSGEGENSMTGFKRITPANLRKNILLPYFTAKELNKAVVLTPAQLISIRNKNKPVFYAIAMHSGERLCREDAAGVTDYFAEMCRYMNIPYKKTILRDNDFNVKSITRTIESITPGDNDIVLFTYSGHGFSYTDDEQNKFPQLALWHGESVKRNFIRVNTINLEDIYRMILAKRARLTIVTGDCCNSYIDMRRQHTEPTLPGVFGPRDTKWNHKAIAQLFLETRQSFLLAAARKGEVAASHRWYGGFFTFHFLETINEKLLDRQTHRPAWEEIIGKIGKEAYALSQRYPCREAVCGQHMISKTGQ